MTLAQTFLEIFCSQTNIGLRLLIKRKTEQGEIIQSLILRILPAVNQVIYTLDTIGDQNIMILAQAVLGIFFSQATLKRTITLQ